MNPLNRIARLNFHPKTSKPTVSNLEQTFNNLNVYIDEVVAKSFRDSETVTVQLRKF